MGGSSSKTTPHGIVPYTSIPPHYGSINFTDDIGPAETLQVGASVGGRLSPVRRFFALLTTFDVIFCFFLWVMYAMLRHQKIADVFKNEVYLYSIKNSLFDLVGIAFIRFVIILITYVMFRMKHWTLIAITTSSSGAFSIAKAFLFSWSESQKEASALPNIILLVASFVMPWAEAWFLDFRVVPSENKASELLARAINDAFPPVPYLSNAIKSDDGCTSFYSPEASDNESNNEESIEKCTDSLQNQLIGSGSGDSAIPVNQLSPEGRAYKKTAEEILEMSLRLFHESNWKTEKMEESDAIQSCHSLRYGKVYKYAGVLPNTPESVLDLLFHRCDEQRAWNPTIREVRVLEKIDYQTDVIYVVSEGSKGIVSCRDFVNLRIWQKRGESYLISVISTEHPGAPDDGKYIRAEQGPMLYMMAPSETNPLHCNFHWLMNVNLKDTLTTPAGNQALQIAFEGWIPQYLIDKAMTRKMLDCVAALKNHLLLRPTNETLVDLYQ